MSTRTNNIALALLFCLFAGGVLCAANIVSNIQIFEQPGRQKVAGTKTDAKVTIFPVLLVEFEDVRFSVADPSESFNRMLNGTGNSIDGADGSVCGWLESNFSGRYDFSFDVSDVITLPNPVAVYGAPGDMFNDTDVHRMVMDACGMAAQSGMDFSRYDNDGDGSVDNVSIIFAGYSEAEGGDPDSIWPQQQTLRNRLGFGDIVISSFTCTAELAGSSGNSMARIGHFCHEFSHFLGLRDLYDTNGEQEGMAAGTYGTLSVMDRGNFLDSGSTPPLFNAVEREVLGICTIEDLLPEKQYTIAPYGESDTVYRIPTSNEGEYFLLECRVAQGWDSFIGGSGLVVYHVDKSSAVYGGISCRERWEFNNLNCFAEHECVRVVSAAGPGADVEGVFFPGAEGVGRLVSSGGKMPLKEWKGHPVGIGLEDIVFSDGKVSFRTVEDYSFNAGLPKAEECIMRPFQRDVNVEWQADVQGQEGEPLQWLVQWRETGEGQAAAGSLVSDGMECNIAGLKPGVEYSVEIRALKGMVYGEALHKIVKTIPVTSVFPYIYIPQREYREGDTVHLRLINLVEKHVSVEWYADGAPVDGDTVWLGQKGSMEIMAVIVYSDGSDERIYKKIEVR